MDTVGFSFWSICFLKYWLDKMMKQSTYQVEIYKTIILAIRMVSMRLMSLRNREITYVRTLVKC